MEKIRISFFGFLEEIAPPQMAFFVKSIFLQDLLLFIASFLLFSIAYFLGWKLLFYFLKKQLKLTNEETQSSSALYWIQSFLDSAILKKIGFLIYFFVLFAIASNLSTFSLIEKGFFILVLFSTAFLIDEVLKWINIAYSSFPIAKKNPIKGYLQLFKIFFYILLIIVGISSLLDKSPKVLLGGIGAATAIILLLFRDTILSLVASMQIFSNRLISTHDWIEVPSFKVDGEVIDINLHQVIIKNWDKSLTIIPIYQIMNTSFKNWSNMYREGRRIKRSLWIDQKTVIFFSKRKLLETQKKWELDVLETKEQATNLFLFRKYIEKYLREHPQIDDKKNVLMVRNLEPTPQGIPVQLYAFCTETNWVVYEEVQSEIIENIISTAKEFDLKIFQIERK